MSFSFGAGVRDSLSNLAASLGAGKDKAAHDAFTVFDLGRAQVEAMYRGDWLARKVVDIVPWSMPLMVLLREMGFTGELTAEEAKKLERMTVVVCIVFDRASRCVLGLSLAANATTANAISAMELAVSPKEAFAKAVGAKLGWKMRCTPDSVVHDAGNEFIDVDFKTRVIDMRSSAHTAMAGKPSQRGGLERLNGTFSDRLLPWLRGRTFANPVRRGKYDSKKQANLLVEEARDVLLLFILSVYHHSGHKGLGGRTPAREWDALADRFGLAAPPDRDRRRHIFGVDLHRQTGPHGVTLLGLQYTSVALQEHFRDRGSCKVEVRIDPLDLGALSLRLPDLKSNDWLVIDCRTGGFDQVTVAEWEKAACQLQQKYGREAALTQSVVDAALARIRDVSERHLPALGLGADRPTRELIEAVEHSLQIGFAMPADRESKPVRRSLIDGGIPRGNGASTQVPPSVVPPAPEDGPGRKTAPAGPVRSKSVAVPKARVPPAARSDGSTPLDVPPVAQHVTEPRRPSVERRDSFSNIGTWRVKDDGN